PGAVLRVEWLTADGQRGQRGLGAAAAQDAARRGRVTQELFEPVEDQDFDLGRPGRLEPHTREEIGARAQPVHEYHRETRRAGNEAEETRVVNPQGERRDGALEVG